MKIKLMSYNVLHSFRKLEPPYALEKDRLKLVQKIVKAENPDVLGLPEAGFNTPNLQEIFMDYQKLFGFPYAVSCPAGNEWGCVLLSRYPIATAQPLCNSYGNGIRSRISKSGRIINIDLIHPKYDASDEEKVKFVKPFLEHSKSPYFLLGDFNAYSDDDTYDRKFLIREFKKFDSKRAEELVGKLLHRKLVPYIKSFGLIDALYEKGAHQPTVPTPRYQTADSKARIDYIFHSADIKIKDAYTLMNKQTDRASDHYPLVATLEIN
jgi:endonuclease/exonuclease/phosphatase family metal-dependent hydrolase